MPFTEIGKAEKGIELRENTMSLLFFISSIWGAFIGFQEGISEKGPGKCICSLCIANNDWSHKSEWKHKRWE